MPPITHRYCYSSRFSPESTTKVVSQHKWYHLDGVNILLLIIIKFDKHLSVLRSDQHSLMQTWMAEVNENTQWVLEIIPSHFDLQTFIYDETFIEGR